MSEPHAPEEIHDRIPRCPECGNLMQPLSYGWWHCPRHPLQLVPDRNLPDHDQLRGRSGS
jgi:hypothetical protein